MMGRTRLELSEFRMFVAEIEAVLNDRPLQQSTASLHEEQAISPAQLMYGRQLTTLPYDHSAADLGCQLWRISVRIIKRSDQNRED